MTSFLDSSGLQYAWNSTSVKLVEECLYKYKLVMLDGWQSPERSVHLWFGGHYASALESYHRALALGATHEEAVRGVTLSTLIATWAHELDDEGNRLPGTGEPEDFNHNIKTRGNLIRSIIWYLEHFRDSAVTTVIDGTGTPLVEYSGTLAVDDDILFAVHLDRVVNYAGGEYIQDQKTTGTTISARFFEGFAPDTQMSMYTFVGRAAFSLPVKGVMIDAAQIAVGFTRFERGFTFRTEGSLNEWYDSTMHHIESARRATREQYFPMNTTACGNYGGCPFRTACQRSPEHREPFLAASYIRGTPMNPLSHR